MGTVNLGKDWEGSAPFVQEGVGQGDIVEALEEIREQNPGGLILLVADNYGSHHTTIT